jgi:hypothetical protein
MIEILGGDGKRKLLREKLYIEQYILQTSRKRRQVLPMLIPNPAWKTRFY